ncbi:MAG: LTA synthase family protein [Oscillospiraceae bacterium]
MRKIRFWLMDLKYDILDHKRLWLSRLFFGLGPFITYIAVEILNNNNPFTSIELWRVLWNFVWYIVIFAFFWLVTGRRRRAGAITAMAVCFVFGLINHYVLRFRGTMFFPIDILSARTAANVSSGYNYTPDAQIWGAAAIAAAYILLWVFAFREKKGAKRAGKLYTGIVGGVLAAFLFTFFCTGFLPAINLYAEQWVTQRNGFVFNFMLSLRYSFVSEPEGYSLDVVEEIQEEVHETLLEERREEPSPTPEPVPEETVTRPTNIILIMNESFSDLSVFENYETNRDPLTFIHSMEENTVKGWFYSPVFGGGTANVEYEVLTGNPSHFLPNGTVAYQLYVDSDTPSLATVAGDQGYTTYAFHPYLASGWNRMQAYEYLGFDHQLYDEDVEDPKYVRDFISDESDFDMIKSITEREEGPVFLFNVTMQNHSGYGKAWTNLPRLISATGAIDDADSTVDQYLCLVNLTDRAFREMVEYYADCGEPTLIAMFGDHQPPLSTEFYELLMGGTAEELSNQEMLEKYKTPFVIWANYDIPEQQDLELSGSFFGLLVSDLAGLERTEYMEFVAQVMESVPVIHDLGYITAEGEFVESFAELSPERQELLSQYEFMAYHNQFDREDEDAFYEVPVDWDESID